MVLSRRSILTAAAVTGVGLARPMAALAIEAHDFISGSPVPALPPVQLSPRVWMIQAPDGFPLLKIAASWPMSSSPSAPVVWW